ncbi:hypothetical protein CCACVL1_27886 [Corchorus capsularis]|uniref:Uncharacterized protein n=1 Tax=Corchorus capsularis TaxID=210143 RepID=A0A1R3G8G4_COCAP|nr:hypothetical protein CCACVL1_27886 [Corchorus capsularis]
MEERKEEDHPDRPANQQNKVVKEVAIAHDQYIT